MSQATEIASITEAFTNATGINTNQTTIIFFALVFGILLTFSLSIVFKKSDEIRRTESFKELGMIVIMVISTVILVLIYSIFVTVS